MKRLFGIAVLIIGMLVSSLVLAQDSKTYWLYTGSTDSGSTTEASGTSPMVVGGGGKYSRADGGYAISGMDAFDGYWSIQLDTIEAPGAIGDSSGATFSVRWQESDLDNTTAWNAAGYHDIIGLTDVALSGATKVVYNFKPDPSEYIKFSFLSGDTPFNLVKFKLRVKDTGENPYNKPVILSDEDIAMASTTVYTLSPPDNAMNAMVSVEGDSVRWKGYTTNPSALNGAILSEGDYLILDSRSQINNFKATLSSGGSGATIYVQYYGPTE